MIFLQAPFDAAKQLPSFKQLIDIYGPWLGLIVALLIVILILQYYWSRRVISAKNDEIKRLVTMEEDLHKRIMTMIDQEIGFRKKK